jgi:hypothetical protein
VLKIHPRGSYSRRISSKTARDSSSVESVSTTMTRNASVVWPASESRV